jgi:hypothetical protein
MAAFHISVPTSISVVLWDLWYCWLAVSVISNLIHKLYINYLNYHNFIPILIHNYCSLLYYIFKEGVLELCTPKIEVSSSCSPHKSSFCSMNMPHFQMRFANRDVVYGVSSWSEQYSQYFLWISLVSSCELCYISYQPTLEISFISDIIWYNPQIILWYPHMIFGICIISVPSPFFRLIIFDVYQHHARCQSPQLHQLHQLNQLNQLGQ